MTRRRFLLGMCLNRLSFVTETFTYLYHSLIPSTINGRTVPDKSKAKIGTIYGNGVVENQLIDSKLSSGTYNSLVVSTTDSKIAVNGTADALTQLYLCNSSNSNQINLINGHKYLLCGLWNIAGSNTTYDIRIGNHTFYDKQIFTESSDQIADVYIVVRSGAVVDFQLSPVLIDLTQMFGTGNEPTTLTDNRILRILARGYIPYNEGTYKSTIVSEIEAEAYNLFDGELEIGSISTTTGENQTNTSVIRSVNYTKVCGGKSYTVETISDYNAVRIYEYDEDKNLIANEVYFATTINRTLNVITKYVRFVFAVNSVPSTNQICFHLTGTRTGYAPHTDFIKLTNFTPNKVNSIVDTFKATETGYTFTRNIGIVDLGSLSWSKTTGSTSSDIYFYSGGISSTVKAVSSNSDIANVWCSSFITTSHSINYNRSGNIGVAITTTGQVSLAGTEYDNMSAADFKTAMSGVLLYYELATPTTVTMPLKHLGMVDLGSLTFAYDSTNKFFAVQINDIKSPSSSATLGNYFISQYANGTQNDIQTDTTKNMSYFVTPAKYIGIRDLRYTDAATFKNAMNGVYLYYETADVVDETDIVVDTGTIKLPAPVQLDGAISAHNTFAISNQNAVFTRNVGVVDLGLQNWTYETVASGDNYYTDAISNSKTNSSVLCEKYGSDTTVSPATLRNNAWISASGRINITADGYSGNTADFKTAMAGVLLCYELATPQTITIPLKNLGVVDLGTLSWTYDSTNRRFFAPVTNLKNGNVRDVMMYCSLYISKVNGEAFDSSWNMVCYNATGNEQFVYIHNHDYTDTTAFKNAMSGVYLFYETNTEVVPFTNKMNIENGGTINGVEYRYVENQLANGVNGSGSGLTYTWSNGVLTISGSANANTNVQCVPANLFTQGHKYLISGFQGSSSGVSYRFGGGNYTRVLTDSIITYDGTTNAGAFGVYVPNGTDLTGTNAISLIPQLTDLTLAFGSGNEPTSINDWRIQDLMSKYIEYNTGTETEKDCDVLPNADMLIGVK